MKRYVIREDTLKALLRDSSKCKALEYGGVDNWSGYDLSVEDYLGGLEWDDIVAVRLAAFSEYKR